MPALPIHRGISVIDPQGRSGVVLRVSNARRQAEVFFGPGGLEWCEFETLKRVPSARHTRQKHLRATLRRLAPGQATTLHVAGAETTLALKMALYTLARFMGVPIEARPRDATRVFVRHIREKR